jgi:hypothetical protein
MLGTIMEKVWKMSFCFLWFLNLDIGNLEKISPAYSPEAALYLGIKT